MKESTRCEPSNIREKKKKTEREKEKKKARSPPSKLHRWIPLNAP